LGIWLVWEVKTGEELFSRCCALAEPVDPAEICRRQHVVPSDNKSELDLEAGCQIDDNYVWLVIVIRATVEEVIAAHDPLKPASNSLSSAAVRYLCPTQRAIVFNYRAVVVVEAHSEVMIADTLAFW
jgi:hypothetical protein